MDIAPARTLDTPSAAPTSARPTERRTYYLFVEKSFPVERIMTQVSKTVGLSTWDVVSDSRGFLQPGEVAIQVQGTRKQLHTLERRWAHTVEMLGETASRF